METVESNAVVGNMQSCYFLEVNIRLCVENGVIEMVSVVDLTRSIIMLGCATPAMQTPENRATLSSFIGLVRRPGNSSYVQARVLPKTLSQSMPLA